jgi:hypothetical protein
VAAQLEVSQEGLSLMSERGSEYRNFDFYSICKLFLLEVWQRWKQLQNSVAETISSFYKKCNHRAL